MPTEESPDKEQQFADSFAKVLNRHGFGFQYSVLKQADTLFKDRKSDWEFEASEFPVEVQGYVTHIDFILRRARTYYGHAPIPFYMLAECKRANPAMSNWCFMRAPYTYRNSYGDVDTRILETLEKTPDGMVLSYPSAAGHKEEIYHIGLEVRSNIKGDETGDVGQAIEKTATQISRGLNGFINVVAANDFFFKSNQPYSNQDVTNYHPIYFFPVIFTTANLFVADVNVSLADVKTGKCELTKDQLKAVPWLEYQYALSPNLKHSIGQADESKNIQHLLRSEYTRTIAIVGISGIEDFLQTASGTRITGKLERYL